MTAGTAWLRVAGRSDLRLMPRDAVLLPLAPPTPWLVPLTSSPGRSTTSPPNRRSR
ncbi:MAG: hypothetical protein ACM3ML_28080 [Micromonosporaceae bacterium]